MYEGVQGERLASHFVSRLVGWQRTMWTVIVGGHHRDEPDNRTKRLVYLPTASHAMMAMVVAVVVKLALVHQFTSTRLHRALVGESWSAQTGMLLQCTKPIADRLRWACCTHAHTHSGLSHKDVSKLGTSIDRRQREHEFFSRIVQAAQEYVHGSWWCLSLPLTRASPPPPLPPLVGGFVAAH